MAEFIGYAFTKNSVLKLEKAAILYGTGANGKSVFFDIVQKLFGDENVSNFSLNKLTDPKGYERAMLSGKLLNYASEISTKLDPTVFKQLVFGEPIEARQIFGKPFTLVDYAKLMFNTNALPTDTEANHGFFRRFLLISFDQTIPEAEQDKGLAGYVIETELSGVFNWVLDGLKRLLNQKGFSSCLAIDNALKEYRKNSDSVNLFIDDGQYVKSIDSYITLKVLYNSYVEYCKESGYKACSNKTFAERLRTNHQFIIERKSAGKIVFVRKVV